MKRLNWLFGLTCLAFASSGLAASGKLLATPGVSQVEGSAGGGIVPWAQLAGYASDDEIAINGFCSRADVSDYRLDVCGAQLNIYDRVEFSYAEQRFEVPALNTDIEQSITGAKVRLYGDIVYSKWPQLSLGVQHKSLDDGSIANLLGAKDTSGTDVYLAASKLHLGALAGYNWFWNTTFRYSDANQLGLLGFGGPDSDKELLFEASTAVFLTHQIAVGVEYREKSNNLGLGEQDWQDVFVAWFPNKYVSVTAAWLDLGS
ncbi:MAG: DUF3034 family protein, partial [Pseudoalteromonas shioyasakiensis]